MKEQVDLEVQETNVDLTNYKTLVYNGVTYPDYMINFEGTDVYDLKNQTHVTIYDNHGHPRFCIRNPERGCDKKQMTFTVNNARMCSFYEEILACIDITGAKHLVYNGVEYKRYLIFPTAEPKILDLQRLEFLKFHKSTPNSKKATSYWKAVLDADEKQTSIIVHIATMWTFNGPPPDWMKSPTVDHKDGNGLNNAPSNLQWMSIGDNVRKGQSTFTADSIRDFCKDLMISDTKYSVDEIGAKHGLTCYQARLIYHRHRWCNITSEFPEFPKRPVRKRKQKVTSNTLF
jgi:hypothetical protein